MPLFAPAQWARRVQAEDNRRVAEAGVEDVKRQIAVATAQAYLLVIAAHRVVESQVRARDTAQAFYDYASQRLKAGAGSRLTALQAQQTLSTDQVLVETFELALFRAQEALGVLVTSDRPLDAVDEPAFEIPEEAAPWRPRIEEIAQRADIKFINLQIFAAKRVVDDSWKDWMPTVNGVFQPAFQQPGFDRVAGRAGGRILLFDIPVFDAGERRGVKMVQRGRAAAKRSRARRTSPPGQIGDPASPTRPSADRRAPWRAPAPHRSNQRKC